jgi:metal-responsive CopG/Arc/MetJ family transcriptional regulator
VASEMIRTHVLLPKDVVEEIDRSVGERRRSGFLAEAAREKLERQRRVQTLERFAGWLKDVDIPGWETPEATAEWVHRQRRIGEEPSGTDGPEPD